MKLSILFIGFFVALCRGQQRIAGGETTTINAFPFAAALLTNSGSGTTFTQACGGTILTRNAILSAASCFVTGTAVQPAGSWRVRVGSSFRNAGGTIFIVSEITPHPNYVAATYDNNIAVLVTRFNIDLVPGLVEQVFLPGAAYTFSTNQRVQAIGWGANVQGSWSDQLRQVEVFVVDQAVCTSRYSGVNVPVTTNMLCAGWLDVGIRGQCEGDVGGPLLDGQTVVGVFSHNRGCADYWFPAINTRVPLYTSWIVATARAAASA